MKIVLVRPDGIGDEILCLPVASALRSQMPDAHITFLSSAYAAPVLQHHPDLDAVLGASGAERFGERVAMLRGFDAAIFLKPFKQWMIAAWAARVPIRVATGYRWYSVFMNRRVYEHRHDFSRHESEYNLGLLRGLGLTPGSGKRPALIATTNERQEARARLDTLPWPRVVVHPGGFSTRRWRTSHYGDLVAALVREGYGVILTGSADERARFSADVQQDQIAQTGVLNLMGQIDLRELMAVIAESDALVSGATGPAHLAAALGCPFVSLFDPRRNALPIRWQPLGRGVVLRPQVPTCEKCIYEKCPYWDCLDRITVDEVMSRVLQVLRQPEFVKVVHV